MPWERSRYLRWLNLPKDFQTFSIFILSSLNTCKNLQFESIIFTIRPSSESWYERTRKVLMDFAFKAFIVRLNGPNNETWWTLFEISFTSSLKMRISIPIFDWARSCIRSCLFLISKSNCIKKVWCTLESIHDVYKTTRPKRKGVMWFDFLFDFILFPITWFLISTFIFNFAWDLEPSRREDHDQIRKLGRNPGCI